MTSAQQIGKSQDNKYIYITMLNIVACFGVIMLHVDAIFNTHPKGITWITSNLIHSLMIWPVPVFFMITGATLLDYRKRYTTKVFIKKRFLKTFIPFVIWSIIAFYYFRCVDIHRGQQVESWLPTIEGILNHKYMAVYWFFVPLFAIYLSMPALNLLSGKLKLIRYLILYAFISYSVFPFISNTFHFTIDDFYSSPVSAGYILFVLLGYYLHSKPLTKKTRTIIYALGITGFALRCVGTYMLTPDYGGKETINQTFMGYLNFPCVFYVVAIFVFFKHCNFTKLIQNNTAQRLINKLHESTFGIYLVHQFCIYIIAGGLQVNVASLSWRIFGSILIFLLSFAFVQCIKRIPLLRYIVP